ARIAGTAIQGLAVGQPLLIPESAGYPRWPHAPIVMLSVIALLDRTVFRLVSFITQLLLVSAVAYGISQVIARFVLQSPADWYEAWTRASLIWAVMLGLVLAFRHGAMLSVEILRVLLSPRYRRWLETIVMLIVVAFLGFMAWVGAEMTYRVRFQNL